MTTADQILACLVSWMNIPSIPAESRLVYNISLFFFDLSPRNFEISVVEAFPLILSLRACHAEVTCIQLDFQPLFSILTHRSFGMVFLCSGGDSGHHSYSGNIQARAWSSQGEYIDFAPQLALRTHMACKSNWIAAHLQTSDLVWVDSKSEYGPRSIRLDPTSPYPGQYRIRCRIRSFGGRASDWDEFSLSRGLGTKC